VTEPNFICHVCHQAHEGLPPSFAADFPDMYASMSGPDRGARALISSDQCVVDEQCFFIRGCLEIPIIGTVDSFVWGLWASVNEDVFNEISESWDEHRREKHRGPFKARLANSLAVYPENLNLKLRMLIQPIGTRPLFVTEEDQHPLAVGQRTGISRQQAAELSATLLHMQGPWSKLPQ
jgi:hypothetical protein